MVSKKRPRVRQKDPLKAALASARKSVSRQEVIRVEDELVIKEAQIEKLHLSVGKMNEMFDTIAAQQAISVPARFLAGDMRKLLTAISKLMLHFHNTMQVKARKDLSNLALFTKVSKSLAELNKLRDSLDTANIYFRIDEVRAKLDHAHVLFEDLVRIWEEEVKEGWEKINAKKGITNGPASSAQGGAAASADAPATSSEPAAAASGDGAASSADGGNSLAVEIDSCEDKEPAVGGTGLEKEASVVSKDGEREAVVERQASDGQVSVEGKFVHNNTGSEKTPSLAPQVDDEEVIVGRLAAVGVDTSSR